MSISLRQQIYFFLDLITATRIFNYVWDEKMSVSMDKGKQTDLDSDLDLEKSIAAHFKTLELAPHPPLIEKAKKLYKSITKNRLTILYGPTLTGKSTILKVS